MRGVAEHVYLRAVIAIALLAGAEVWRRKLRHRAPAWVHGTVIALMMGAVVSAAAAQWGMRSAERSLEDFEAGNKATLLAEGASLALNASAASVCAALLAVVVLAIAAWRARRMPTGGPVAQTRR